ncbi:MAG: hypothetical protein V1709_01140 [Planctomycetota bacterium]
MLKPLEVKTSHIATYAVTTSKIAKCAVTTDKIVDDAVTNAKLQDGAVTANKIKDKVITNDKIADKTITQDKLVLPITPPSAITRPISPQVESAEINDGAITRAKIAVNAVENDNIKDGQVTSGKLASSAVTTAKIADSAVTKIKLASNSVGYLEIIDGSVEPRHIRAVDSPADGEVPSYNQAQERFEWVAPGGGVSRPLTPPIATEEIADNAVTTPKIGELQVTSSKLQVESVTTEKIADGAVTIPKLGYKVVGVVILQGQYNGDSANDPDLVNGQILGFYPTNQRSGEIQIIALNIYGSIRVTLLAPALYDSRFSVIVLRG